MSGGGGLTWGVNPINHGGNQHLIDFSIVPNLGSEKGWINSGGIFNPSFTLTTAISMVQVLSFGGEVHGTAHGVNRFVRRRYSIGVWPLSICTAQSWMEGHRTKLQLALTKPGRL